MSTKSSVCSELGKGKSQAHPEADQHNNSKQLPDEKQIFKQSGERLHRMQLTCTVCFTDFINLCISWLFNYAKRRARKTHKHMEAEQHVT